MNKRGKAFSGFSDEDKANAFKLHLALQFVKRPNLTAEQKDLVLESISAITTDAYDRTKDRKNREPVFQSLEVRATSIFSRQEAFEIFASLGGGQTDVEYLQKYLGLANIKKMPERKEFFRNASSQDKSQYWKIHFALSLVLFPDLNKQQKEVILDAIALVNPQIYETSKTSSEWKTKVDEPTIEFSNRALRTFDKEKGVKIFVKLGGEVEPLDWEWEIDPLKPDCDCSIGSIAGCGWEPTCAGAGTCNIVRSNCGFLWQFDCDGKC